MTDVKITDVEFKLINQLLLDHDAVRSKGAKIILNYIAKSADPNKATYDCLNKWDGAIKDDLAINFMDKLVYDGNYIENKTGISQRELREYYLRIIMARGSPKTI